MNESERRFNKKDILYIAGISAPFPVDMTATHIGVQDGYREYNPVTAEAIDKLGNWGTDFIAAASILVMSSIYLLSKKIDKKFDERLLGAKKLLLGAAFIEAAAALFGVAKLVYPHQDIIKPLF